MKPDELIAWLNERGADKPCPACDANDWAGEIHPDNPEQLAVVGPSSHMRRVDDEGNKFTTVLNYEAFMLSCKNCGFIRLHHKGIVMGKLDG